jgi:DNA-binding Lrp family transcriptional regulator
LQPETRLNKRHDADNSILISHTYTREGHVATRAYILIKVKAGKTKDVVGALKRIPGVEQAHSCFGRPDIFVFISVQDERALSDVVITKIHAIDGVEETDTHIVAES